METAFMHNNSLARPKRANETRVASATGGEAATNRPEANALHRSTHHRLFGSLLQFQIFGGRWTKFFQSLPGEENSLRRGYQPPARLTGPSAARAARSAAVHRNRAARRSAQRPRTAASRYSRCR